MTADTTTPSYWLNWRFLLCAVWVLLSMVFAAFLIWRYEGHKKSGNEPSGNEEEAAGCLYKGEVWGMSLKSVHPVWLLVYRVVAFGALLALLLADVIVRGGGIFYYYTQWTFTLVTVYFGLGSLLSIHGCLRYWIEVEPEREYCVVTDAEGGSLEPPLLGDSEGISSTTQNQYAEPNCRPAASIWEYALQIIFQICAGAVVLTDSVFWMIIYPFLTPKSYRLTLLQVCMHSVNAVFLLGDAIFSSLRYPFFRLAYFALWTCIFVIFQWIIHACVSLRWPYSFLDLSSPYAPLWYFAIGLLHLPCYGIFTLIFRIKQCYLPR